MSRFHPFPTLHFTSTPFTLLHFTTFLDDFHFTSHLFTALVDDIMKYRRMIEVEHVARKEAMRNSYNNLTVKPE
jgi:hypothetical protein